MALDIESNPYALRRILPAPVQKLYSSTACWYTKLSQSSKNTLNWMLMVKENINNNENTVTLPDDTVVKYTGGCILHDRYYRCKLDSIYSYLAITTSYSTLIITAESQIKSWIKINECGFKFSNMKCYPIYSLHDTKYHDKIVSADIIITTMDIFAEIINPSPNLSNYKRFALSNLRNKKWCNLVIDTVVPSELVNNISATYKWVTMSDMLLNYEKILNMLHILFPHQYERCTNYCSYILPSVVMNTITGAYARLTDSRISRYTIQASLAPLKILDPLQNIVCEVKAGTDSECCICTNKYDNSERVGIRLSCGHQFCTACLNIFRCSVINCPMCRCECVLKYVIIIKEKEFVTQIDRYINKIREYSFLSYTKNILCVDDANHIEKLYDGLKMHINVTLLNKRIITVNDIYRFNTSNSELLIVPYNIKFELGVDLLFICQVFIISHQERPQCYEYLMSLFNKILNWTTLDIIKLTL